MAPAGGSSVSDALANLLDLPVAWLRVKVDLANRVFVRPVLETRVVESDLQQWLLEVDQLVRAGRYHPGPMVTVEVPKPGYLIRPGSQLSLVDHLVYTACVGACLERVHATLAWAQGTVDFAYQLAEDPSDRDWLRGKFNGWNSFREMTLARLTSDNHYVVFTDISAFYENIALSLLASDLRGIGVPDELVNLLSECLNRWGTLDRGIPQGISASDILAKLYLNSVDLNLRANGMVHMRYVDDLRVVVDTPTAAKQALVSLTELLRRRGLNLQSAKTKILDADGSRRFLEGAVRAVSEVGARFLEQMKELYGNDDPYMTFRALEVALLENPESPPVEILEQAYVEVFGDPTTDAFDATLFHFLLSRLAKAQSEVPFDQGVTSYWATRPEETHSVCGYLDQGVDAAQAHDAAASFLASSDAIYPYQRYQILQWLSELPEPSQATLEIARRFSLDHAQPPYVRAAGRKMLGDFGTASDLERLESQYEEALGEGEKCELIYCLRRMEPRRRNAFLARAEHDGPMVRRAARLARAVKTPGESKRARPKTSRTA